MTKNALVPKIKLQSPDQETIVCKPIASWFIEFSSFDLDEEVALFQDKADPKRILIKGTFEPIANLLVLLLTIVYLTWFAIELS